MTASSADRSILDALALAAVKTVLQAQHVLFGASLRVAFGSQRAPALPAQILLLNTGALGDFLFAVPAMRVLRTKFPAAEIVLLTASTTAREIQAKVDAYAPAQPPWLEFVVPSLVNRAVAFRMDRFGRLRAGLRAELQGFRPDATIILPTPAERFAGLAKKLAFLWLLGMRGPVFGWRTRATYSFFRGAQFRAGLIEHKVRGPLRAIGEYPGVAVADLAAAAYDVSVSSSASDWAAKWIARANLGRSSLVAVAPGSIHSHKQWPISKYSELVRGLVAEGARIVVVGTVADAPLGEQLVRDAGSGAANLCGLTLMQSAALLKRCKFLIANDGGAVHLATAVGCPVVSIVSGLEYPGSVDPWSPRAESVRIPVPCAPCYSMTHCPLGTRACVQDIPTAAVVAAVQRLSGERKLGGASLQSAKIPRTAARTRS